MGVNIDFLNKNITIGETSTRIMKFNSKFTFTSIHNDFGGINSWSSEKSTDVSTVTTWLDYAGVHNLANPAAGNQPTVINPDADFNNLKTYSFLTDDYVSKNFPNYGLGLTTGSLWAIIKTPAVLATGVIFAVASTDQNTNLLQFVILNTGKIVFTLSGSTIVNIESNVLLAANTKYILEVESNETLITLYINGILTATTNTQGINQGQWFNSIAAVGVDDNISIGARLSSAHVFFNGKIVYVGNFPLLSAANRAAMFNQLNSIANVY